jgi:hypothetical protein
VVVFKVIQIELQQNQLDIIDIIKHYKKALKICFKKKNRNIKKN